MHDQIDTNTSVFVYKTAHASTWRFLEAYKFNSGTIYLCNNIDDVSVVYQSVQCLFLSSAVNPAPIKLSLIRQYK